MKNIEINNNANNKTKDSTALLKSLQQEHLLNQELEKTVAKLSSSLDEKNIVIDNLNNSLKHSLEMHEENIRLHALNNNLEEQIKQRTASLYTALKAAEKANKSKSVFLSNMSHEIRTPMHSILSFSELGTETVTSLDESKQSLKLSKYFDRINSSGNRLRSLLDNILDCAKLESGETQVNVQRVKLLNLVQQSILGLESEMLQKNQQIVFLAQQDHEAEIDKSLLVQVIQHLLINAIKFTPVETPLEITIQESEIESKSGHDSKKSHEKITPAILFSIRDHGDGIPETELDDIFEKFTQSYKTSKDVATTKGTGLGLRICKEIIRLHQGKIWAENHPKGGALFTFIIPVNQNK